MTAAAKIYRRLDELAGFSENPKYLDRPVCSDSALAVNEEIKKWAQEDAMDYHVDALFNVRLRSPKHDPNKKTFVVASHLDSVVNAGKFDGPLGFLIAYEMLAHSIREDWDLPFNLEAIGFCDEEGVRYQTTYLGSSGVAGIFNKDWLGIKDKNGISLEEALQYCSCSPEELASCAIPKDKWLGYYEVHIEQGPVLEAANVAVGMVSDIYGQIRVSFEIKGEAGHAGTVPMHLRKDALAASAEFILFIENYAKETEGNLVATIGQCEVLPGASNVISGRVKGTIDIRSHDTELLNKAAADLEEALLNISKERKLNHHWNEVQRNAPVYCHEDLNHLLEKSLHEEIGSAIRMSSGAGHDGVAISKVAPISMLFVRSKDGISHNPLEYSSPEDVALALKVSLRYLENLKENYSHV